MLDELYPTAGDKKCHISVREDIVP